MHFRLHIVIVYGIVGQWLALLPPSKFDSRTGQDLLGGVYVFSQSFGWVSSVYSGLSTNIKNMLGQPGNSPRG